MGYPHDSGKKIALNFLQCGVYSEISKKASIYHIYIPKRSTIVQGGEVRGCRECSRVQRIQRAVVARTPWEVD